MSSFKLIQTNIYDRDFQLVQLSLVSVLDYGENVYWSVLLSCIYKIEIWFGYFVLAKSKGTDLIISKNIWEKNKFSFPQANRNNMKHVTKFYYSFRCNVIFLFLFIPILKKLHEWWYASVWVFFKPIYIMWQFNTVYYCITNV